MLNEKLLKKDPDILIINKVKIKRGERKRLYIEAAALYDYTKLTIPVEVIRSHEKGPVLFISAAVHGDELNGVEIIRKLLQKDKFALLRGTLILVPIVNVFGFNHKSRYLPDRRDLNRSFPGSKNGSLASRLAYIFMKEIVSKSTHGIDLHTGAIHRSNLPQIRACLDDQNTKDLAEGFGVPVVINSKTRDGSLREAARKKGVSMLLFEGGEALRFEETVISVGLRGCLLVMASIGMIDDKTLEDSAEDDNPIFIARSSHWTRAPHSGAFSAQKAIGDKINVGDLLAIISDPYGDKSFEVFAEDAGILIGAALLPLVNQGDAMFHVATFRNTNKVKKELEKYGDYDT